MEDNNRRRRYTERPSVKTKIIATVGPATETPEHLRDLALAGVDVFRLNFAHASHEWLNRLLASLRQVAGELNRPLAVLGDLSGPKIRLGELTGGEIRCEEGHIVRFVREPVPNDPFAFTSTYDNLLHDIQPGDRLLLADGTVTLRVLEKADEESEAVCVVEQPGVLRSRQGINLPGVNLSTPALTEKDKEDLRWAVEQGVDFIGLSFVRSADDLTLLRNCIDDLKPAFFPQVVAKIEKKEAVDNLDAILRVTDAVMVARGDLGVEVDMARLPPLQKQIIRRCNQHRIPVITATQMLDSMQWHELPTRAECSDVANAVLDGSDSLMLSGETAVGRYPVRAVSMMSRIAREAEHLVPVSRLSDSESRPETRAHLVTEAVTLGASLAAEHLGADLVVVATHSGRTAMAVSKQRSPVPVLALTDSPATARRMCLYWGVIPVQTEVVLRPPQELREFVLQWGRQHNVFSPGSRFVIVGSTEWSDEGHDLMLVHVVP